MWLFLSFIAIFDMIVKGRELDVIKAIFFDIDGTLLTSMGKVLPATKQAIAKAQAQGIYVGVATGRGPSRVKKLTKGLDLDMWVTYNGQLVSEKDKLLFARPFEREALQQIITYADQKDFSLSFGAKDAISGSRLMNLGQWAIIQRLVRFLPKKLPVKPAKKLLQAGHFYRSETHYQDLPILQEPIYQCMMLNPESEDAKVAKALSKCDLLRSNHFSVDLVPKGGSKFKGIQVFMEEKGLKAEEVMAFGDHQNDIEMIKGVGIGVAMGNGKTVTKEAADYVTASNNLDGIAKALAHFEII